MNNILPGNSSNRKILILFCLIITLLTITVKAQPSGGPYGPVQQTYELPDASGTIYYAAPNGKADAAGTTLDNPTTIESAIEKVKTGDAIILRGGTYRTGNLVLNQGITIQPYKDELPILKGTFIADKWKNLGNGLWTTKWEYLFPSKAQDWWRREREGKKTPPWRFNDDMVFVNGKFLQSAGWEGYVDENTYYIDYDKKTVYIGVDPKDKLVEITAFNIGILRTTKEAHGKTSDKKGYTLRGVTITQYAYRALEIEGLDPEGVSPESAHGKDVVGTTIENCTISFCSRVAGYFRGDKMTIRNCKVSDTSTEGIYILSSNDVLLEKNILQRNNIEFITGYYPSAVKIFNQCYRVTCRDNYVTDLPYSNGIWYDVGNVDGVFVNNWIENVGNTTDPIRYDQPWPSQNGFFFEISKNAICAGNVFVNCDHGTWSLNASNVKFYNNTYINSIPVIARNARSAQGDHFGWHPATGPDLDKRTGHEFVNNLLVGDENFTRPLLYVWQPDTLKGITDPQLAKLDNNIFVRASSSGADSLILWSSGIEKGGFKRLSSPEDIHNMNPEYAAKTVYLKGYSGSLFKGKQLGNYEMIDAFKPAKDAAKVPSEITKVLGIAPDYIGAYPPVK